MVEVDLNELTNMHPIMWIPTGMLLIILGIVGTIAYPFLISYYKRRWKKQGGVKWMNRN